MLPSYVCLVKRLERMAIPGMNTVGIYMSGFGKYVVHDETGGSWKLHASAERAYFPVLAKLIRDPKRLDVDLRAGFSRCQCGRDGLSAAGPRYGSQLQTRGPLTRRHTSQSSALSKRLHAILPCELCFGKNDQA